MGGGLALKYAELPPVPFDTSPEAEAKREALGTTIQKQIINDATRYTYGDAHMEGPLKALKLAPTGFGPPTLVKLAEAVTPQGQYSMTMRFWQVACSKMTRDENMGRFLVFGNVALLADTVL